jgi:hypothetical protein
MHFLILLRIKGPYMFRALRVHPQEALDKRHFVCCVRIVSVGCRTVALYTRNIPSTVCSEPPEDDQVIMARGETNGPV